ncbi:MAG: type II toxin-antitoxin system VapC family toxin [Bryobacteraceae bacterium]
MIIPDINLLIYAYNEGSRQHEQAKRWWEECLSGKTTVGLPWVVSLGFLRLTTSAKVFTHPMPVEVAAGHVRSWLERPVVQVLHPGGRHADIFFEYIRELGTAANLTTDAHLAALAVEYQAVLHSTDADFGRFSGLRWRNPIG